MTKENYSNALLDYMQIAKYAREEGHMNVHFSMRRLIENLIKSYES